MTEGYNVIAEVYDRLNAEIDYVKWADFVEEAFDKFLTKRPELVLDLACGTGIMTRELAMRGYDMIGADGSAEMLSVAADRAYINVGTEDEARLPILYLLQDMRSFELYGTVGAVTCCLDSINYLTENADVEKCFSLVHNYLDPNGLFLFDVNSPYKFENIYGDNAYILENENGADGENSVFCAWQNRYDRETCICDFYLTLFSEDADGRYIRQEETQRERMYKPCELEEMLRKTGFDVLGFYGDMSFGDVKSDTERIYIAARALK